MDILSAGDYSQAEDLIKKAADGYARRTPKTEQFRLHSPAQYPFSSYASCLMEEADGLTGTGALPALAPKGEFAAWHVQDDKADRLDAAWRAGRIGISDEKAMRVMRKPSCNCLTSAGQGPMRG